MLQFTFPFATQLHLILSSPRYPAVLSPHHLTTPLSCHHTASPHHLVTPLSCHHTASPHHLVTLSPHYLATSSSGHPAVSPSLPCTRPRLVLVLASSSPRPRLVLISSPILCLCSLDLYLDSPVSFVLFPSSPP